MKFLCVEPDEAMKLSQTRPPDAAGSLTVLSGCPRWETAEAASRCRARRPLVPVIGAVGTSPP